VNVFFEDKREAMSEYMRVTKPGGYVGINEMTWLRPPSPEVEEYFKRVAYAEALEASGWTELLEKAGLKEVVGSAYQIDIPLESKGRFERYGYWGIVKAMLKMLVMFFKDRRSREFLKDVTGGLSKDLFGVVGYGVYVGRKG
jgi:ubiquinone/menaquinone biosynthesis C-methylase UbiE